MVIVNERLDLTTDQYSYTIEEISDQVPAFFLGVRIGVGF